MGMLPGIIGLMVLATISLILFFIVERRKGQDAMLDTSLITGNRLFAAANFSAAAADYHATGEIPIGGVGRFDYLFADSANRRLYVSHGTSAVVIDLDTEKIVGSVSNTPGIHGIAVVSDLGFGNDGIL